MAKEYNIDDILLEVKKRKDEAEKQKKSTSDYADDKAESKVKEAEKKIEQVTKKEPVKIDKKTKDTEKEAVLEEKKEVKEKPASTKQKKEPVKSAQSKEEVKIQPKAKTEKTEPAQKDNTDSAETEDKPEQNNFVDLNTLGYKSDFRQDDFDEEPVKKKGKKKKIIISIICVILALLIALATVGYLYVDRILDHVADDNTENTQQEEQWDGMATLVENFEPINEADAREIASLKEMIKKWYYNGTPCSSSHVLNVMLVGEDGYDEEEESRADSAIIASINIDTQTITLTSVLRDTYAYWETEPGNEETGVFGKINGAKSSGDITTYINAVEHLYKIKIDNYATVNFESFKTIIDSLGGVDIEITQAEINEINNDQKTYDGTWIDKTFEGKSGVMRLTGQQALSYCRIRHLDSDNMRADRQKECLTQIFNALKDASSVKLLKIINDLVPYVKTDMKRDTLIKIAKYALSEGWMQYDIVTNTVPNSRINERGAGGEYYGAWCWKSDFPQDAYNLQTLLYGKSSITLARTRVDVIKCRESGFRSDGLSAVGATIINEHYGEVSTLPETTTEEESSSN